MTTDELEQYIATLRAEHTEAYDAWGEACVAMCKAREELSAAEDRSSAAHKAWLDRSGA